MLTIAIIADALTRDALAPEARLVHLTPLNYKLQLRLRRPDFLLVESVWQGVRNRWKYKVANYPDHPKRTNSALVRVVEYARMLGIPTVFWNKEDGVHFDRFIQSASHFDHVFTVDSNCLSRYRALMGEGASVHPLMFAVQPRLHFPTHTPPVNLRANFVGSYSHHIHDTRRTRQDMLFDATLNAGLELDVYDRNSARKAAHYRYPARDGLVVKPAVSYARTADVYRDYLVSLNVNTIEDSPSMVSRRLVEIIGCGALAATTPALSVATHFAPYCHVLETPDAAQELFARLARKGHTVRDTEMMRAGADYIHRNHTWAHRLEEIARVIF